RVPITLLLHLFPTRRSSDLFGVAPVSDTCLALVWPLSDTSLTLASDPSSYKYDRRWRGSPMTASSRSGPRNRGSRSCWISRVTRDRKSTRLNSSHGSISYAV